MNAHQKTPAAPDPERIVVAWDGSPEAEAALDLAAGLAARTGSRLKVVSVVEPHVAAYADTMSGALYAGDIAAEEKRRAEASLAELRDGLPIEIETELRCGHAAHELLDAAGDADLIVLGSRGRGGFARALLGSTSSEVSSRAGCPVIVVPRSAAERVNERVARPLEPLS